MNIAPLKKSIAKETLLFFGILTVIAALLITISMVNADYEQEKSRESSATTQLLSEKQTLDGKFAKLMDNMELFQESQSRASGIGLVLDSEAIRGLLAEYQQKFLFGKLTLDATTITEIKEDQKYVRQNFIASRSKVKIGIEALSDEDVYALIRALHTRLPGFVKVTSFKISKQHNLTKEILSTIQKSGAYSLISAEFNLEWYGLKSTKADDPFNVYKPTAAQGSTP